MIQRYPRGLSNRDRVSATRRKGGLSNRLDCGTIKSATSAENLGCNCLNGIPNPDIRQAFGRLLNTLLQVLLRQSLATLKRHPIQKFCSAREVTWLILVSDPGIRAEELRVRCRSCGDDQEISN
jgi:hypothetical protein